MFLETAKDVLDALAPVIDRWPKYAWVAKQLLEAERVSLLSDVFFWFRPSWCLVLCLLSSFCLRFPLAIASRYLCR